MNIQELPDYFALQHLSQSLWRNGESRGAALFVGAGSSRFAELAAADTTKPPLWSSLRAAMAGVIYPGASEGDIPADPLRLAEEYRALLGQAALDDFIRHQVPDHAWKPSEIHARLLRLPWADVLSTNWDTLLERAARSVGDREYEVISVIEDIARAKSPRIVKLHGSLPAGPFIFAEEDYRTYPTKHAPLVNLARQVFLENEFCLLGFSGTDPNFLQWSGWVRDHLGESARRIYLVGVLNLRPAARRLLEDRNVAPIDFGPLVRPLEHDRQHLEAIKLFLAYLENSKPRPIYDWSANLEVLPRATTQEEIERPYKDKAYAASLLDMAATTWEAERNRYPGWIVCPSSKRDSLRTATSVVPMPLAEVLDHLPEKRRPRILYELAWRFEVSFWPVPDFLVTPLQGIAAPTANSGLSGEEHLEVAVLLLRNAREHSDQSRFDSLLSIIKDVSDPGSDARATAIYQQCLWARDHLDFARLASLLPELTGNDPIWGLRRAALHCDLGEYEDADALVIRTLDDLRSRQQLDRRSLWVLSRRAWAQFLDGAAVTGGRSSRIQPAIPVPGRDEWPLEFKAMKADPWDELRAVEDEIDAAHRESAQPKEPIKPHFEAGVYSETDGGLRFRSWSITPPGYALERLEETAGIPINFEMASILRTASERYVELQFEPSTNWYLRLIRVLRSHSDNLIERYFNRISIARLSSETVSVLLAATVGATYFWRQRSIRIDSKTGQKRFGHGTIARIQLYLEIVSRLAVRASEADARKLYALAIEIGKDNDHRHWWLFEPLDHLLLRSAEALPKSLRGQLAIDAIEFPLPSEIGIAEFVHDWPNPVAHIARAPMVKPPDTSRWSRRIGELIEAARIGSPFTRQDASKRLFHLFEDGLLSAHEQQAFGAALWEQLDPATGIPRDTELLAFVFLRLPSPDHGAIQRYFLEKVFKTPTVQLTGTTLLELIGAATARGDRFKPFLPPREEALRILDGLLSWRPVDPPPFELDKGKPRRIARRIGPTIALAIAPTLQPADWTVDRTDKLFQLIESGAAPSAMEALPLLTAQTGRFIEEAANLVRRSISSRGLDNVIGSMDAIRVWLEDSEHGCHPLPRSIIEQVVWALNMRQEAGLPSLLWSVTQMLAHGMLTTDDQGRIVDALQDLLTETRYARADIGSHWSVSLSLIRAECVRLAHALSKSGLQSAIVSDWLDVGRSDPLPEVRWALSDEEQS